MKIVYVDATGNENNEIGSISENDFYMPMFGSIIDFNDQKYEFKKASEDNLKDVVYLYLVKH